MKKFWSLLPGILAFLADAGHASKIILIHESHEGSHAICESMNRLVCGPVTCGEVFDHRGVVNFDALNKTDGVVLIHAQTKDLEKLDATDAYVVIARTDNVRWTLSQYYKWNMVNLDGEIKQYIDPQFSQTLMGPPEPRPLDMNLLARAAGKCKSGWMAKLKLLDWLKVNKRNFALAIYEQFVQSEYDYIRGVLKHIGKYDEKCDRTGDEDFDDNSYIHRVHNGDLEEYATNVDEVLQFYSTHSYPTWAECCGRFHEEAHPLALPRPSTEGNGNASATR